MMVSYSIGVNRPNRACLREPLDALHRADRPLAAGLDPGEHGFWNGAPGQVVSDRVGKWLFVIEGVRPWSVSPHVSLPG